MLDKTQHILHQMPVLRERIRNIPELTSQQLKTHFWKNKALSNLERCGKNSFCVDQRKGH